MTSLDFNSVIFCLEDNLYMSTNKSLTQVFLFEGLPCYGLSQSDYTKIMCDTMDMFNQVDPRLELSFITRNKKDGVNLDRFLNKMTYSKSREEWIRKTYNDARIIETYLCVSLPTKNNGVFSTGLVMPHKKRKDDLKKDVQSLVEGLTTIGYQLRPATLNEVGKWCYEHLNLDEHNDLEIQTSPVLSEINKKIKTRIPTIREQVSQTEIDVKQTHIEIDGTYIGVVTIELLGTHSDIFWYQHIHQLLGDADHEIALTFRRKEKESYTKQLFKNQKDMEATLKIKAENVSNFDANKVGSRKSIYADQVALMDDVSSFPLEVFEMSFSVSLKEANKETLNNKLKAIKKAFQSSQFHHTTMREAGALTPWYYHGFLPGNAHQFLDKVIVTTLQLLYFMPINRYYKGYTSVNPMGRVNQLYKTPNNEIAATHSFYFGSNFRIQEVTATTGSGKSFDLIKQIDGVLSEKTEVKPIVLVVEPKRGMLKLTRLYEGEIVNYSPTSTKSFNPFPEKRNLMLPEGMDYEGYAVKAGFDPMLLAYFENLLEILVKEESKPTISARIKGVFSEIIRNRYESESDDFVLVLPDIIEKLDSYKPVDDQPFVDELNRVKGNLQRYCAPQYENLFLKRESLNLSNDLVYFDLSAVDDNRELKELGLYILGSSMIQKLRVKNRPTYLYLDEASVFYQTKIGATLLEFFVRQARSLGGAITIATQSAQDKLKSSVGDILGENISIRKCLYLENGHDNLTRVGFLDPEVSVIRGLKKKPGHFVEQFQRIAGVPMLKRSKPDSFLYWLSTNDEKDDQYFYAQQEKTPDESIHNVIERCAKEKPHGA
jgi:hypothetical protein